MAVHFYANDNIRESDTVLKYIYAGTNYVKQVNASKTKYHQNHFNPKGWGIL